MPTDRATKLTYFQLVNVLCLKKFVIIILVTLLINLFGVSIAEANQNIRLGVALFSLCKHYTLITGDSHSQLDVDSTDKNFIQTRQWALKHIYDSQKQGRIESANDTKYTLMLFSEELPPKQLKSSADALLLTIPLDAETLGSDHQNKMADLQKIMARDRRW